MINNMDLIKAMEYIATLAEIDDKSLVEKGLKCSEEVGELSQAILSHSNADGCGYKGLGVDDIIEESIDVVIVAMSILFEVGGDMNDFKRVFDVKMSKWSKNIGGDING